MCYEKPKNWGIFVGKVISYDGKRYLTLDLKESPVNLKIGDGIEVWNGSNSSPSTIISEIVNGKIGRIHGDIHPGDKVYKTMSKSLNQKAKESYSRGFARHEKVEMTVKIQKEKAVVVKVNHFTYTSSIVPQISENQPLTIEKVTNQFSKLGNTPFDASPIHVILEDHLFLPVSSLNALRREAMEAYEKHLLAPDNKKIEKKKLEDSPILLHQNTAKEKEVSVFFNLFRKEYLSLKNVTSFYFTLKDALKYKELIQQWKGKKYILLPLVTKGNYEKLIKQNIKELSKIVDGFVLSNIGQLAYFGEKDKAISFIANHTLNTFNTYAISNLKKLGFSKVILSPELTKSQINSLGETIDREVIAYGNTCVMTSEYCPVGAICGGFTKTCKCSRPCTKGNAFYLKDRLNMEFRILPDAIDCQSQIFNSKITSIATNDFNVESIRIDVIDETPEELQKIINVHKAGNKLSGEQYTNRSLEQTCLKSQI